MTAILTEFLLARIAEDEAAARDYRDDLANNPPSAYDVAQVGWIEAGSPERVLARCEADRRIVALHPLDPIVVHSWGRTGGGCNLCEHDCTTGGDTWGTGPCDTLLALAAVYADHPDYREEWRP